MDFSRFSGLTSKVCTTCDDGETYAIRLGKAVDVMPGCPAMTSMSQKVTNYATSPQLLRSHTKTLHPRSGSTGVEFSRHPSPDCRHSEFGCTNGGVCVPSFDTQTRNIPPQHICKCLTGFEGSRCESSKLQLRIF